MAMAKKNTMEAKVGEVKAKVAHELEKSRKAAEKEIAKMKKSMNASVKKAEDYVKKNPAQAAAIAAGVGAAVGAAVALLLRGGKKK